MNRARNQAVELSALHSDAQQGGGRSKPQRGRHGPEGRVQDQRAQRKPGAETEDKDKIRGQIYPQYW